MERPNIDEFLNALLQTGSDEIIIRINMTFISRNPSDGSSSYRTGVESSGARFSYGVVTMER